MIDDCVIGVRTFYSQDLFVDKLVIFKLSDVAG